MRLGLCVAGAQTAAQVVPAVAFRPWLRLTIFKWLLSRVTRGLIDPVRCRSSRFVTVNVAHVSPYQQIEFEPPPPRALGRALDGRDSFNWVQSQPQCLPVRQIDAVRFEALYR
jgi:hypothetical protein